MDEIGSDDIPPALLLFHKKVVAFSEFLQQAAETKYNSAKMRPISHQATFRIHSWAIVLHKAIRDNCLIGWAQVSGVLLRALLDCFINIGLIGEKDHDLRAFSFFYHYQLSRQNDTSIRKDERDRMRTEIQPGWDLLEKDDQTRIHGLISAGKLGGGYWYSHEFRSPADVLKRRATTPDIRTAYNYLSGASHGGHVSSNLFLDEPDDYTIEPLKNPKSAALAIAYSSRFLLEICRVRVHHEIPELQDEVEGLVKEILGLKELIEAKPA